MKVFVSTHLHGYTGGRSEVRARGTDLDQLLDDLDRQFPGLRFRVVDEQGEIRPHLSFFINQERVRRLSRPLAAGDEIHILGALSGG